MAPDPAAFRLAMSHFASGVTIVTTGSAGRYHGMTVSSFASLSLEPMLVLVCIDKTSHTYPVLQKTGGFGVNILAESQEELSRLFADSDLQERHSLAGVSYRLGSTGLPLLDGCLAGIECHVVAEHDGGDHAIIVGEAKNIKIDPSQQPLIYFRRAYRKID